MFLLIGEKLYVGFPILYPFTKIVYPGIIVPSQGIIAYFKSFDDPLVELGVCKEYEVLTCKVPDLLYWESSDNLDRKKIVRNAVSVPMACIAPSQTYFIAQVNSPITEEWTIVSQYNGTKFSTEFSGPVVGTGVAQTTITGTRKFSSHIHPHDPYLDALKVYAPYNGKIFEVGKFSLLCCHEVPKLSNFVFPEVKWIQVWDGRLPSNAFAAGTCPNGEILYIGKKICARFFHPNLPVFDHEIFGCGCSCTFICEVLATDDQGAFEWSICSAGEVPPHAVGVRNKMVVL